MIKLKIQQFIDAFKTALKETTQEYKLKSAINLSLNNAVCGFKRKIDNLSYKRVGSVVIGGRSNGKFVQVDDPRGKYIIVQISWSFDDRNYGDAQNFRFNERLDWLQVKFNDRHEIEYIHETHIKNNLQKNENEFIFNPEILPKPNAFAIIGDESKNLVIGKQYFSFDNSEDKEKVEQYIIETLTDNCKS